MMPGHSHCLPLQLLRGLPALAFLFVLMTITFETSRAATSCSNRGHVVKQTANLARHLKEKTQELQKLYIASQGDFHESFCQSRVNNLPDTTIAGNTPWEKLQSLYTTLNVFYRHLGTVKEQQEQLQEPSNPLLHKLGDAQAHTSNLAGNVQEILQCLEPNEPVFRAIRWAHKGPSQEHFPTESVWMRGPHTVQGIPRSSDICGEGSQTSSGSKVNEKEKLQRFCSSETQQASSGFRYSKYWSSRHRQEWTDLLS